MPKPETTDHSPETTVKGWISGLEEIDPPSSAPKEAAASETVKEPDGQTDTRRAGNDDGVGKAPAASAPAKEPAPPPADAKPDEAKPADDLGEDKWPRSAQEWKKFKEARKQAIEEREQKIAGLNTSLDELKKKISETPATSPELDTLRKERDELSDRLRTVDVERHPKFKAYFDAKLNTQVELAKRIVGPEHAEAAARLMGLPEGEYKNAQIEELMVNMTPLQQSRFGSVLNSVAEVEAERQSEIAKGRENYDRMVEEQKGAQAERAKAVDKAFNDAALKAQDTKEGNFLFQKREGDHDWNRQVEERLSLAKNLLMGKGVTQEQVIAASFYAAATPALLAGYDALHAENEALKQQVAELSKAAPTLQSTEHSSEAAAQTVPVRVGSRPDEVIRGWVKGLQEE